MIKTASVSPFRLAGEAIRCNLAGIGPGLLDWAGIAPLYANFWVTTRCSGRCLTCTQWSKDEGEEMETAEAKRALLDLRKAGVRIIYFVGGDVLLRNDIFDLIRFASRLGLRIHLTINAFTVTEEIARDLMTSGLASLHLSLDSLGEDFAAIRGVPDAAPRVLGSLALLERHRNPKTELGLTATVMKSTLPSLQQVVELALEGRHVVYFNLINFTHDFFATNFSKDQYHLNPGEKKELAALLRWLKEKRSERPGLLPRLTHLEWIGHYFEDHRQKSTPCYQTLLKICVHPNGDVRPCCSMETAGNLRDQDLRAVLRSPRYLQIVKRALAKDCPGCSCRYTLSLDVNIASRLREYLLRWGFVAWNGNGASNSRREDEYPERRQA